MKPARIAWLALAMACLAIFPSVTLDRALAAPSTLQGSGDWALYPGPTGSRLRSISMVSSTDGWIVGDDNVVLRFNGSTWTPTSIAPNTRIYEIAMRTATDGWASGYDTALTKSVIYHWNGSSWTYFNPPSPFIGAGIIVPVEANDVWFAAGFALCNPICSGDLGGVFYHWNGSSWTSQGTSVDHIAIRGISMVSAADGWAVGEWYDLNTASTYGAILRWNGSTWTVFQTSGLPRLQAVSAKGASNTWAVGSATLKWDGVSAWNPVTHPGTAGLYAVEAVSTNSTYAVGSSGLILHWNGSAWQQMTSPTVQHLYDLDMLSDNEGWAIGANGVILHYYRPPVFTVNYPTGSPGSFFNFTGSEFPPSTQATISVNGRVFLDGVPVDGNGNLSFQIDSSGGEPGRYIVSASVNPKGSAAFTLSNSEPLRARDGTLQTFLLPGGIAFDWLLNLGMVYR